ncbi:MAG: hypothetical protein ACRDRK_22850 [Pseudonocardia sp.]
MTAVPEWVTRSRLIVAATEEFLLWLYGQTGAPDALGSRVALAWVGGCDDVSGSPMTHRPFGPAQRRAVGEFMVAEAISGAKPYPPVGWFEEFGVGGEDVPARAFWESHAGWESTRSYARGVTVALGWLFGAIEPAEVMTPRFYEDGVEIPDVDRQACAQTLHDLSVRPLPAPAYPVLTRHTVDRVRSWTA